LLMKEVVAQIHRLEIILAGLKKAILS